MQDDDDDNDHDNDDDDDDDDDDDGVDAALAAAAADDDDDDDDDDDGSKYIAFKINLYSQTRMRTQKFYTNIKTLQNMFYKRCIAKLKTKQQNHKLDK